MASNGKRGYGDMVAIYRSRLDRLHEAIDERLATIAYRMQSIDAKESYIYSVDSKLTLVSSVWVLIGAVS